MNGTTDTNEPTDPARRLGLLWGDRHHSARRGRRDLNLAKIVAAGLALADEAGVAALSMRKVADRLGVGTMSLYTYVPGKDDLVEVMIDTVYAAIAAESGETERSGAEPRADAAGTAAGPRAAGTAADAAGTEPRPEPPAAEPVPSGPGEPTAPGRAATAIEPWRRDLTAVATDSFAAHLAHAWLVRVPTDRVVLGPGAAAKYERELAAVDGIGLSDVEMDGVVSLVNGHVVASARRVVDETETQRASGQSPQQWWRANAPLLAAFADPNRFPTAARVGAAAGAEHGAAYAADGGFGFGLERILDGVSRLVRDGAGD